MPNINVAPNGSGQRRKSGKPGPHTPGVRVSFPSFRGHVEKLGQQALDVVAHDRFPHYVCKLSD